MRREQNVKISQKLTSAKWGKKRGKISMQEGIKRWQECDKTASS